MIMPAWIKSALSWVRSVYSESDGITGSATRVHIGLLTGFIVSLGASFGVLVHKKTISMEQFNSFLVAAATFLTATAGPLYGINKLADWATKKNGSDPSASVPR